MSKFPGLLSRIYFRSAGQGRYQLLSGPAGDAHRQEYGDCLKDGAGITARSYGWALPPEKRKGKNKTVTHEVDSAFTDVGSTVCFATFSRRTCTSAKYFTVLSDYSFDIGRIKNKFVEIEYHSAGIADLPAPRISDSEDIESVDAELDRLQARCKARRVDSSCLPWLSGWAERSLAAEGVPPSARPGCTASWFKTIRRSTAYKVEGTTVHIRRVADGWIFDHATRGEVAHGFKVVTFNYELTPDAKRISRCARRLWHLAQPPEAPAELPKPSQISTIAPDPDDYDRAEQLENDLEDFHFIDESPVEGDCDMSFNPNELETPF